MTNSQSTKAAARRLNPRKTPSQGRSGSTVLTILEGAAHILEQHGLAGYTTNAIAARAGVSIGSLYQYFPTKDAVTVALIERESAVLVEEACVVLAMPDAREALRAMVQCAVRYQLQRPRLARVLDFEEARLATLLPRSTNAARLHTALTDFLARPVWPACAKPALAASDIMALASALTDAAGNRDEKDQDHLARRIEGAVLGYLAALD